MQNQDYGMGDAGARMKDNVSEFGAKAADIVEARSGELAEGLENAAETVRDRFESSVSYLRDHGKDMIDDLTGFVKSHPAQALVGAAVVGFLAARLIRRS